VFVINKKQTFFFAKLINFSVILFPVTLGSNFKIMRLIYKMFFLALVSILITSCEDEQAQDIFPPISDVFEAYYQDGLKLNSNTK